MKASQNTKETAKQAKRLPETVEERVHRHISDINSKITDDDIKSVRTELDIRRDSTNQHNEAYPIKKKPGAKKTPPAKKK